VREINIKEAGESALGLQNRIEVLLTKDFKEWNFSGGKPANKQGGLAACNTIILELIKGCEVIIILESVSR
jgi:hypothetical protein